MTEWPKDSHMNRPGLKPSDVQAPLWSPISSLILYLNQSAQRKKWDIMNLYMHIWRFDPNSFICKRPFFAKKRLRSRIFPEPDVYLSRGSHVIIFHQIFRQNKTTFANSEKNFRGVSCWNPGGLSLHGPFDRQSFIEKINLCIFIEGSLEVKFPTIWTDGKAEVGRVREEKSRREKIREEKEWEERRCRCAKG